MARYIYQQNYKDEDGNVVAGGTVTVYLAGTSTPATCYAAISGGSPITGSTMQTGLDGYFSFYVDDGDYAGTQLFDVQLSKSGFATKTFVNIALLPVATDLAAFATIEYVDDQIVAAGGGVQSVTAGTNVTITGTATDPIINSAVDGVQSVTAGTNVTVTGTATNPIINSAVDGVQTVTAGTNVTVTGTATNPIINSAVDGVQTVTAGTNVTVTGTATDPIINSANPGAYSRPYETLYEVADDFLTPAAIKFQGLNSNAPVGTGSTTVLGSSNGIIAMFPTVDPSSVGHYGSTGTPTTFDPRTLQGVIPNRFKIYTTMNSAATDKLIILGLVDVISVDAAALTAYQATGAKKGVFFRVDDINQTLNHVYAVCKNGVSTETMTDTGIVMAANTYHSYEIIALSGSVLFYIDDVLKATHTTNITTTAIGVYFMIYVTAGSAVTKALLVDWYKFSRPR